MIRSSSARLTLAFVLTASLVTALAACGADIETPAEFSPSNNGPTTTPVTNNSGANNASNNDGQSNNAATVTYHQDVKPLLEARCTECHVSGGIGPFALTTYEEAFAVRDLIASVTTQGTMPPFVYDDGCRDYQHDPTLTPEQLKTLEDWADQGGAQGDPQGPVNAVDPLPAAGLSRIDLTLQMPVEYTPMQSPDDYRCFLIDWPYDTRKFITGFGVKPGNDSMVHHVIAFRIGADQVAEAEALDAAEDGPGYTCFGGPGVGENDSSLGWLGSWAPGGRDSDFPDGTGLPIEPGSKVVLQVHYNSTPGDLQTDRTALELKIDDTVEKEAMYMPWANPRWLQGNMNIPAGDAQVEHGFSYDPTLFFTDNQAFEIHIAGLHMHLLGTSIRAAIKRADGTEDCLADIPNWDFNWQFGARFAQPARFEPGDQLALDCTWDNTVANQPIIGGMRITPADRNWGDGTTDEMCLGIFYVTLVD